MNKQAHAQLMSEYKLLKDLLEGIETAVNAEQTEYYYKLAQQCAQRITMLQAKVGA